MDLKGKPRQLLREALKSGFQDFEALNRFSKEVLNFNLLDRTHPSVGLDSNLDTLMSVMDEKGEVRKLITAAREERPNNKLLREVEQHLKLTFDPFADVQSNALLDQKAQQVGPERVVIESVGFPSMESFLAGLGEAEFRVCVISYAIPGGKKVFGTGFLINNDLVMTNAHVIERTCPPTAPFSLSGNLIEATFDYRNVNATKTVYKLAERDWLIAIDPQERPDGSKGLDYAILRLATNVSAEAIGNTSESASRGFFRMITYTPSENEPILILQHPYDKLDAQPSPMRLTIGFVSKVDGEEIYHSANTSEGSSGSPVFNSRIELIGLHHWGDIGFNVAKRMGAIKDDLEAKGLSGLLS
jgi:hypothetical protein